MLVNNSKFIRSWVTDVKSQLDVFWKLGKKLKLECVVMSILYV